METLVDHTWLRLLHASIKPARVLGSAVMHHTAFAWQHVDFTNSACILSRGADRHVRRLVSSSKTAILMDCRRTHVTMMQPIKVDPLCRAGLLVYVDQCWLTARASRRPHAAYKKSWHVACRNRQLKTIIAKCMPCQERMPLWTAPSSVV